MIQHLLVRYVRLEEKAKTQTRSETGEWGTTVTCVFTREVDNIFFAMRKFVICNL